MSRYTRRLDTGNIWPVHGVWQALRQLAAYEDTGLTPEEVLNLSKHSVPKLRKPAIDKTGALRGYDVAVCPECRHILMDEYNDCFNFCPECGQAIDWSDN